MESVTWAAIALLLFVQVWNRWLIERLRQQIILSLLKSGPRFGLELVRDSNGLLCRGLLYVTLIELSDKGLVAARWVDGRYQYSLTEAGSFEILPKRS